MKASERPLAKIIDICSHIPDCMNSLSYRQHIVLNKVKACRTVALGVVEYECENEDCGHREFRYMSCKNRACSVCSWLPREKWKMQRVHDLLPGVPYFHNVFTIPHSLSVIASQNQVEVGNLLFKCVNETLKKFADTSFEKGQLGYLLVLHTWSSTLENHYHIHAAIPAGYLLNGIWNDLKNAYLFPVNALSDVFRNKFCAGLRELRNDGKLKFYGSLLHLKESNALGALIDQEYRKKWIMHSECTQGNKPEAIMGYLANYVYKTAIDNSRIISVSKEAVEFMYRSHDKNDRGTMKKMKLPPEEFMRRYASHILPRGFRRIRYYGFLGGSVKKDRLESIFEQKGKEYKGCNQDIHRSSCEKIIEESKKDFAKCPKCNSNMLSSWEVMRRQAGRAPPNNTSGYSGMEHIKVCA